MSEKREYWLYRFIRDVLIGLAVGLVLEPTLRRLDIEFITPYLQYVWFGIVVFLVVDLAIR
jgi:hypothetical protein